MCSSQFPTACYNLFSDILREDFKCWWKKTYIIIKPMEMRRSLRDTPPMCVSKPVCVYMCTIFIHIIYGQHAEARGKKSKAEKRKKWVGHLHPLYLNCGLKSLFSIPLHIISNCSFYINFSFLFYKRNYYIRKRQIIVLFLESKNHEPLFIKLIKVT